MADAEKNLPSNNVDSASIHESDTKPAPSKSSVLDWDGPDDPDNPFNWSIRKRIFHTVIPGLLAFTVTFGSSVYAPGVSQIQAELGVSQTVALLGLSLYLVAIGLGPVLAAPLSELYGRRLVYWGSVPPFMLFTVGAALSQTITQLLVCRFFAGVFCSPVMAVGPGSTSDLWQTQNRAVASIAFVVSPFLGPALGPIVGGWTVMAKSWRWTQWILLIVTGFLYVFTLLMSETYKKTILTRRAKRRATSPPPPGPPVLALLKGIFTVTLIRPAHMLVTEPIVGLLSLYVSFAFGILFAFIAAFPVVFKGVYGFDIGESGLPFISIAVGVIIAAGTSVLVDRLIYQKKHHAAIAEGRTRAAPEHRLYLAMFGSVGLPVGLFWFAWTARRDVHWIVCILAAIPFAWGNLCIFMSGALYMIDTYGPLLGASAMAANGLARYVLGAAFPLFTVQMYEGLGTGWATSIFGFISLALLPIPFLFFKYGVGIRARSKYETVKD